MSSGLGHMSIYNFSAYRNAGKIINYRYYFTYKMFVLIPCELANTGSGNGLLLDGTKRLS